MRCDDPKCECWQIGAPPHAYGVRWCDKCKHWCQPWDAICEAYCPEHRVA